MAREGAGNPFTAMAERYERVGVPAIFAPAALNLLSLVLLRPRERVLDVACGTGIVARLAAPRLGEFGQVVGLDIDEGMLSVARAQTPPSGASLYWLRGTALALPFRDARFDVVLCQNGLQYMTEHRRALAEMRRTLKRGGRLALNVVARDTASQAVQASVARVLGRHTAAFFGEQFQIDRAEVLADLFEGLGFTDADVVDHDLVVTCPSGEEFLRFALTSRLPAVMSRILPGDYDRLMANARAQLTPYRHGSGLQFPVKLLVAVARA